MSSTPIVQNPMDPRALKTLEDKAAIVLEEARRLGASSADVGISVSEGLSVNVRMDEVETLEFHRDKGFSVTVYMGQRKGSASSSDDSAASLRETVAAACAIARHTGEDRCAGIADADLLAQEVADLDLFHPWALTPEQAIDEARRCERAGRSDARIVNSDGAAVSSGSTLRVYANSNGFCAGYASSSHSRSCVLVAEQDGRMQRDYWYDGGRQADRLMPPEAIGERAARRTLARLGARRPATGSVPVLFSPEAASGLVGHLLGALSGGALYRRSSFLLDQLGQAVMPAWMSVSEDPHRRAGNNSAPFDSDGLLTRAQSFVDGGVLSRYALSLYASRRLGMSPTGNGGGVRNVSVSSSGDSAEELMRKMGNGILVTEVMGPGVNLVSGDYSRGAAGFMVRDGVLAEPVEEFTIAGNLGQMFRDIEGSGTDQDRRGNIHVGSLLLQEMKVGGQTEGA